MKNFESPEPTALGFWIGLAISVVATMAVVAFTHMIHLTHVTNLL
jgi:hypothetical protein